jgi:hypothetical protein
VFFKRLQDQVDRMLRPEVRVASFVGYWQAGGGTDSECNDERRSGIHMESGPAFV